MSLHWSIESAIKQTLSRQTKQVPLPLLRNITRALIDLKRNKEAYDFGPTQLKALDRFISKARVARTIEDLYTIHKNTCILGLEKH